MAYKFDFDRLGPHSMYKVIRPLAGLVVKAKYRIKYIGVENIPADRGIIVASNHITALDPVIIGAATGVTMHFMAKEELFKNNLVGWFLAQLNSFPVNRKKFDFEAVNYGIRAVNSGDVLGIFPEGTRSPDFKPKEARGGVCYIAKECKCDVVPVSLYTCDNAKTGTRLTVRFGKPIKYEELQFDENSTKMKDLRPAGRVIMQRITELWEEGHGN